MRLAFVGTGAIGGYLIDALSATSGIEIVAIADVPDRADHLANLAGRLACTWHTDPIDVLAATPDVILEAANPVVVRSYAARWLDGGASVLTMSVGALADPEFLRDLAATADRSNRQVLVPSGAIGALDAIRAARIGGLDSVELRTTKPPRALQGAPYLEANAIDVGALTTKAIVFEGTASEAVAGFPANLNVVAALSLAGIGPDRTHVVLVADPAGERNVHEITATGAFGELYLRVENRPTPGNPKTSLLAPLSALALLRQLSAPVRIGS